MKLSTALVGSGSIVLLFIYFILYGTGRSMESQNTTKELSVEFRNLQLKKIKRPEKQANKGVMEEKFSIVCWTEFVMGEGQLKFQAWTLSTPVVVIVHGNQEPQALATVTWDNAFAETIRMPFVVTDKVTWGQVSTKTIVRTKEILTKQGRNQDLNQI